MNGPTKSHLPDLKRKGIHPEEQATKSTDKASKGTSELLPLPKNQYASEMSDDDDEPESGMDTSQNDTTAGMNVTGGDDDVVEQGRNSVPREIAPQTSAPLSPPVSEPNPELRGQSNSNNWVRLAVLLAVVAVVGWYFYPHAQPEAKRPSCEHFLQLHSKYPNTDDLLWPTLTVGVDRAIYHDPGEPATFIFLYNSTDVGQSLLEDVTGITINCFGSGGAIWRTSNDFQAAEIAQDYGTALDRHREEIQSQGVLVVRDLDRVPPTAAQVFFTICDAFEPLVNRAVIFFTIDISGQPGQVVQADRSATAVAEGILKGLWRGELRPDVLDPLVVRLTENVFRIG